MTLAVTWLAAHQTDLKVCTAVAQLLLVLCEDQPLSELMLDASTVVDAVLDAIKAQWMTGMNSGAGLSVKTRRDSRSRCASSEIQRETTAHPFPSA